MTGPDGIPYILEINTRPGSPEGETLLETVDNNLLDLFLATASNQPIPEVIHNDRVCLSLRVINKDYNDEIETSSEPLDWPQLLPMTDDIKITRVINDRLLHSVLTVTDVSTEACADRIYAFLKNKHMGDFTYRTDIGYLK
jgi:phosphoribosylamine-glycine ligase